jgi:hypothetical protein
MKEKIMKTKLTKILTACVLSVFPILFVIGFIGCASHPAFTTYHQTNDVGQVSAVVLPSAWLTNAIGTASRVNQEVPPNVATPFVELGLGALSGILALIARSKTSRANTAESSLAIQTQAADILAAHVVKTGTQTQALQIASGTTALPAVAQHLDNNFV